MNQKDGAPAGVLEAVTKVALNKSAERGSRFVILFLIKLTNKTIAFLCVHDSCRSQIAEALGKYFRSEDFDFYSAGTETKPQINQDAVRLMKQLYGIDMELTQYSKTFTQIPSPDIVISMGCDVGCPYIGRDFDENWGLPDPNGQKDEVFMAVIAQIADKIHRL